MNASTRALALVAAALLTACTSDLSPPPVGAEHRLVAATATGEYPLLFAAGQRGLADHQIRELGAFVANLPPGVPELALVVHAGASPVSPAERLLTEARLAAVTAAIDSVRRVRLRAPVVEGSVPSVTDRDLRGDTAVIGVRVRTERLVVTNCEPAPGSDMTRLSDVFGCASLVDLARMVEAPSDVAFGRKLARPDPTHQSDGVVRYRTDKMKPLDGGMIVP